MRPQEEDGLPQHLLSSLIATTPWNEQVQSLAHLTELALSPSQQTLRQLRSLTPYFQSAINNPRSTLVRSVCETISTLAETLKAPFVESVGNSIIPSLLNRSAVTKAVIRESCVDAARSMFEYGVEGVHFVTVRTLAEVVSDRRTAAPTRATAALFLGMILVDNCREGLNHIINVVAAAIATGCSDPDESVRAMSRENWRRLHTLDPAIASEVLKTLPSQTVQLINRERDEFGDPFRADRDRALRARMPGMADMPARFVPRVGFKPVRVEIDEQRSQKKARPHLRPPRRSILPTAFTNQPNSPDDSPPKRHEMHPARRVFSPMAIDTPAPVHTPASVEPPTPWDSATPRDAALARDTATPANRGSMTVDMPMPVESVPENVNGTPKSEEAARESENIASVSPDSITEKSAVSAVSAVSSSSGSHSATSDSQNPLTDHESHITECGMCSGAGTEDSVSAVSSSSVSTASTSPSSNNEEHFKKIAGSGASRGTNEDSSIETPTRSLHSDSSSVSPHASLPDTKKGRLSFILGTNKTPRIYTPLPPISRLIDPEYKMQTFTPMDICTPMKNQDADGTLSGIVAKPLARALEAGLDEMSPSHDNDKGDKPSDDHVAEETEEPVKEDKNPIQNSDVSDEQHVEDKENSVHKDDARPAEGSTDFAKPGEHVCETLPEMVENAADNQEPTKDAEQSALRKMSTLPDLPSTPNSVDDDLLKEVASITSSAEKKREPEMDVSENTSWDDLVQDLEKTLGLRTPLTDDMPVTEVKDCTERTTGETEASTEVETAKPGEGKENKLPEDAQKQPEVPMSHPEATASTKVEEKEKGNTEMTRAQRQAALARRPPRRSINPGAIKPMPVEKKTVRPSLAPPVPPKTERRKPPVPSFSRRPPAPGKLKPPTASNNSVIRPPVAAKQAHSSTKQPTAATRKPPSASTAQKPPTATTRKLPLNRPRASTALIRPGTSASPASSLRRASTPPTPPTPPAQSSVAMTETKTSTSQSSTTTKPVSGILPKPQKAPKAAARSQTPRQIAVIEAYRACARTKKGDWSTKWKSLKNLEATIQALQGDTLPPRLCDDAAGLLGEYIQETHHKIQLAALDALFFLLLCSERPAQITALNRALEKRPEILRRVLGLLKDGREDARLACGRVMQSFEVLFGPELQIALLVKAVSGVEGKIAEMGCIHMLKTFERAKQGEGFVWKAGVLEALVSLLAGLKRNRRVEVRQSAATVLDAVKECLPDRAFEIVCRKVGVSV